MNLFVLGPGEPIGMYHREADQEDFLILSGEALLLVEGEERPLRQWDFVHCPPDTEHMIIGAGTGPCTLVAIGAREHMSTPEWGEYTVNELAQRHDAGVDEATTDPDVAYARFPSSEVTRYPGAAAWRRSGVMTRAAGSWGATTASRSTCRRSVPNAWR